MNGRVKTLHPLIHGGILADRDNPEHLDAMTKKSYWTNRYGSR